MIIRPGLDNQTIHWKSIAPKPGTSQYAEGRSSKNDQIHVVVVDDTGKVSGTAGALLEKYTFSQRHLMQESANSRNLL